MIPIGISQHKLLTLTIKKLLTLTINTNY